MSVLIASLDDVVVLQHMLAPGITEINWHLAQESEKLKEKSRGKAGQLQGWPLPHPKEVSPLIRDKV